MPEILETRYAIKVGDKYVGSTNLRLVDRWQDGRIFPSLEHAKSWLRPWVDEFPGFTPRIVELVMSCHELDLELEV